MFRLKTIRLECGIKRSKLAEDLQINAGTLANYENEIRQAPYEYLMKFAEYFDVSVDYLLGRNETEIPSRNGNVLNAEETALLEKYNSLGRLGKMRVNEYIDLWREHDTNG